MMIASQEQTETIRFSRRLTSVRTWDEIAGDVATPGAPTPIPHSPKQESKPTAPQVPAPDAGTGRLLQQIQGAISVLMEYEQQQQSILKQTAIELALVAAECVVQSTIRSGKHNLVAMIEKAVEEVGPVRPLQVALNPSDLKNLQPLLDQASFSQDNIVLEANVGVPNGECRVNSPQESYCTSIGTQLESIRRTWLESINDTAA